MGGWQALDEFGFDHVLADTAGTALVMFGQPACGACRGWQRQLPLWLANTALRLFYVDVARAQALANRFELFQLPAFVLYRYGEFHCRFAAPFQEDAVRAALAAALLAPAEEEP
jgi:thioredoxin-like negative regulator of GroEL